MLVDAERPMTDRARLTELQMIGYRRRTYGLTQGGYAELQAIHGGRCAICGDPAKDALNVDHCHDTGTVRGLLCEKCNLGLGLFADDPERLRAAAEYLRNAPSVALENAPDERTRSYRDVAEYGGVHLGTVQRAYTKPHTVGAEMRQRIFAAAEELGVTPGRRQRMRGATS